MSLALLLADAAGATGAVDVAADALAAVSGSMPNAATAASASFVFTSVLLPVRLIR